MSNTVKKNITMMAFSGGQESKEAGADSKRYIGVASVKIEAVNPTGAQLEKVFGNSIESDPVYVGTQTTQDGKTVPYARIEFLLHTVPENNNGIDAYGRMSFFLRNEYRLNRDQTKMQVIDEYGRTAWVTNEELKAHAIPVYSNGKPANITANYRPAYVGEEDLTNFFRAFLNIPSPMVYKDKQWVPADNLADCLARFDNIPNVFKGNFSEFQGAWKLQQNNKVKVLFGIRTANDGRQYQTFYTKMALRNGSSSYERLEADVKATQDMGGMPSSEFKVVPLQEYVVESTPLNMSAPSGPNPFGDPADNPFFN